MARCLEQDGRPPKGISTLTLKSPAFHTTAKGRCSAPRSAKRATCRVGRCCVAMSGAWCAVVPEGLPLMLLAPHILPLEQSRILEVAVRTGSPIVTFNVRDFRGSESLRIRTMSPGEGPRGVLLPLRRAHDLPQGRPAIAPTASRLPRSPCSLRGGAPAASVACLLHAGARWSSPEPAVIQTLKEEISGMIEVNPEGVPTARENGSRREKRGPTAGKPPGAGEPGDVRKGGRQRMNRQPSGIDGMQSPPIVIRDAINDQMQNGSKDVTSDESFHFDQLPPGSWASVRAGGKRRK
jgi:hypothetical protein